MDRATIRATCWSITINNPTDADFNVTLPAGWKIEGQMEVGENGTPHYQAMLTTPQVRFSAVKKIYQRAHIEPARTKQGLTKYVHKEGTRTGEVEARVSNIPTLFDYQHTIAGKWNDEEFIALRCDPVHDKKTPGEKALEYVDILVERDILAGVCGVEYIAINPMWRSAWKRFWRAMVERERQKAPADERQTDSQTDEEEEEVRNEVIYPPV